MYPKLIPRTILFDLLKITLLSLFGVSMLFTLVLAMVEASRRGLDPIRVLAVVPFFIPPMLPYTIPCCLLFACTVVYGGMSNANEITALKASGVHVGRVLWPAVVIAVLCSLFTLYLSDRFIPASNRLFTQLLLSDLQSTLFTLLKTKGAIAEPGMPYEIYVESMRDDTLINPVIIRKQANGKDVLIQASEATMQVVADPNNPGDAVIHIRLIDGRLTTTNDNMVRLIDHTEKIPIPNAIKQEDVKIESLTFDDCREESKRRAFLAANADLDLAMSAFADVLGGSPADYYANVERNRTVSIRQWRKSRESIAELHVRFAQSAAALPFVLLGCPLSILFQRREFLQTFFICFVPIITVFYPVMILGFNIFKEGQGSLLITLWSPSIIMILVSVVFLRRIIRY